MTPIKGNAESPNLQLGSIEINLETRESTKLKLAKVAKVVDGRYVPEKKYEHINIDLNQLQSAAELKKAAEQYKSHATEMKEFWTDESGKAKVEELEVGVYLLCGKNVLPFLVSIPTWNEATQQMQFDVEAYPKHSENPGVPQAGDYQPIKQLLMCIGITALIILFVQDKIRCKK